MFLSNFLLAVVVLGSMHNAVSQNLDWYKCHPDCGINECCLHNWNAFGKRELNDVTGHNFTYCAPLLVDGDVCYVQHAVEQCPCAHGLICVPEPGEYANYHGRCRPG